MDFFEEQKEQSHIKSEIVKKYFWVWGKIIGCRVPKIAYIDLYAGPGLYDDGSKSTPILVLENALRDDVMRQKLVSTFNDINPAFTESLERAISEIPNIETLTFQPIVTNLTIGDEIVNQLKSLNLVPTLLFVDPWGYKGLTLGLIGSVLKDWGCDCIFFFNYVRINAGIGNKKFDCHIDSIFGKNRAKELRANVRYKNPRKREELILFYLKDALREIRGEYVISYKFYKTNMNRTSHFLIFVSKNILGYKIMKGIMAELSSHKYQNVATFEYNPHVRDYGLFPPTPLDELEKDLLKLYNGKTLSVGAIIQQHNFGTPYIESNYKEALLHLEDKLQVYVNPPADKRPKRNGKLTMADAVLIRFKNQNE
jgi:three-Cys-motif partner protein